MNKSLLVILLAWMSGVVISQNGLSDMSVEEGTAIFNCLTRIVCDARKPYELRDMWLEADPVGQQKILEWITDIYEMDAKDDPQFWDNIPEIQCPKSDYERREEMKEFMLLFADFYEKSCIDPSSDACVGMNKYMAKLKEIKARYTAIGVCENPATFGKKVSERTGAEVLRPGMRPGMKRG